MVSGGDALQQRFRLVFNRRTKGKPKIAEALGLEADGIGIDLESLKGLTQLQRGAVENGGIEGADAKLRSDLDQRDDVPFEVHGAAARGGSETKAVATEDELVGGNFSFCRHESVRIAHCPALPWSALGLVTFW